MDSENQNGNTARDIELYAIYCSCFGCIDPDPGEILGAVTNPELGSYLDQQPGSISWNKFAPSKAWYNDTMYLPSSNDVETLDYYPIYGYNSIGFKLHEGEGLLDCIIDGHGDFFPYIALLAFYMWNCVDYKLWMIFRMFSDFIINTAASSLFWLITPKKPHSKMMLVSIAMTPIPLLYPWCNETNTLIKWSSNTTLPCWATTILLAIYFIMFTMTFILIRSLYLIDSKINTNSQKTKGKQQSNLKSTSFSRKKRKTRYKLLILQ